MLNHIVEAKRLAVAQAKVRHPLDAAAVTQRGSFRLRQAIESRPWSLIAECKLASPAKGRLTTRYSVVELAQLYEANGAAALSVHTDPHFLGRLEDIAAVKAVSKLPVLRKDFIVDEYQLYETAQAGADGVLLIAAVLTAEELRRFQALAVQLGLDCLVEVHGAEELPAALAAQAPLLGINNRDLNTFRTDVEHTYRLLPQCAGRLVISESGVRSGEEARRLRQAGVRGILVGEGLVVAEDVAAKTRELALVTPEALA